MAVVCQIGHPRTGLSDDNTPKELLALTIGGTETAITVMRSETVDVGRSPISECNTCLILNHEHAATDPIRHTVSFPLARQLGTVRVRYVELTGPTRDGYSRRGNWKLAHIIKRMHILVLAGTIF